MPKFRFRLEPILNLKIQVEDNLKNELGKAIGKLEEEKSILLAIENEMDNCMKEINIRSAKGMTVKKMREYGIYTNCLREKTIIQKENINLAEQNVDKLRRELLNAAKERQMFEKLREKKHQEFLREENKLEQKLNDELISYNYSKN